MTAQLSTPEQTSPGGGAGHKWIMRNNEVIPNIVMFEKKKIRLCSFNKRGEKTTTVRQIQMYLEGKKVFFFATLYGFKFVSFYCVWPAKAKKKKVSIFGLFLIISLFSFRQKISTEIAI